MPAQETDVIHTFHRECCVLPGNIWLCEKNTVFERRFAAMIRCFFNFSTAFLYKGNYIVADFCSSVKLINTSGIFICKLVLHKSIRNKCIVKI